MAMIPAGSVTFSTVKATAAPIQEVAEICAFMSGTRSVASRSASVGGRSSLNHRATGAYLRLARLVPNQSVNAR